MKYKVFATSLALILIILSSSGCLDVLNSDGTVTYESHPTSVSYVISYGYKINCTGSGEYNINYDLDYPEVFKKEIVPTSIGNADYQTVTKAGNKMLSWDIHSSESTEYELVLTANVEADSFIVSDLDGENALTIEEINSNYPVLVSQYCRAQSYEINTFIDPFDPDILDSASEVFEDSLTNNSFLVAKELFRWFKEHTEYRVHAQGDDQVQPAALTLSNGTGDCDDLSFLYISLCRALSIPARFVRGFLIDGQNAIHHAWAEVFVGGNLGDGGWIPVECAGTAEKAETEIHQNFGVESVEHLRLFRDDGSNESLNISLSGVSYTIFSEDREVEAQFYSIISDYSITRSQKLIIEENGNRRYE